MQPCHIIQLYSAIFYKMMHKKTEIQVRRRILLTGQHSTIQKLCLDNIPINTISPNIKRIIQTCTNLRYLTLNHCELTSLQNFPHLNALSGLQLEHNELKDDELIHLTHNPSLSFLSLANNTIYSTNAFNHLKPLKQLQILEIQDNPACDEDNYRQTIFKMLPSLKVVNCQDQFGNFPEEEILSEYISSIGSRRDLLEGWDQIHIPEQANKQEFSQKINDKYEDEIANKKTTLDSKRKANTDLFQLLQMLPEKPQLQKQETVHSQFDELQTIPSFTRKYLKKQ